MEQGSSRRFIAIGKETADSSCKNGNSDFILGKNLLTVRIANMLEELPGEVSIPGGAQNAGGHSRGQSAALGPSLSRRLGWVTSGVPYSLCVCAVLSVLLLDHRARTDMWCQRKCQCYSRVVILLLVHPLILSSGLCCFLREEIMPPSHCCISSRVNCKVALKKRIAKRLFSRVAVLQTIFLKCLLVF